jgi:hypothetical protein
MKGYRISFSFEGFTGADIVLTPLKTIISQDTIQSHLDAGAALIQVKNSRDFDASVIDQRLFEAILRMNTWDSYQHQNGLLITGDFQIIKNHLYIDGHRSRITASSYLGALNSWVVRGGVVYPTINVHDIQLFIDLLGQKLFIKDPFIQAPTPRPRKKFKPQKKFSKGMTLRQKARLVGQGIDEYDLRHILINFDGLTTKHVDKIWTMLTEKTMSGFIALVLSEDFIKIKGIGPKTVKKIRRQLGYE